MTGDLRDTRSARAWAWGVHILTAMGGVVGLLTIIAVSQHNWLLAMLGMAVVAAIDSVDGTLARAFRVKERVPQIDGALLDNMVDYFTYVIVPAYFFYEAALAPPVAAIGIAVAVVFASAYQFSQADAKTEDCFFKGFPSYWNVVVLYLFLLGWPAWLNAIVMFAFAAGVFVPIKYVYPSRTRFMMPVSVVLTIGWAALLLFVIARYPEPQPVLLHASLLYPAYYLGLSFYLTSRKGAA